MSELFSKHLTCQSSFTIQKNSATGRMSQAFYALVNSNGFNRRNCGVMVSYCPSGWMAAVQPIWLWPLRF